MGQIAVKWSGDDSELFLARDSMGHVTLAGSWPDAGASRAEDWTEWRGLKPSDLLLVSLGSCSGYDVVMILRRQRQELTGLYVEVEGSQSDAPPHQFTDIHLHYILTGKDLEPSRVERAIKLSEERYCSVAATVRGVATLSHSYEIRDQA